MYVTEEKLTLVAIGIWLVSVLISVGLFVGGICVAIHFIHKFW